MEMENAALELDLALAGSEAILAALATLGSLTAPEDLRLGGMSSKQGQWFGVSRERPLFLWSLCHTMSRYVTLCLIMSCYVVSFKKKKKQVETQSWLQFSSPRQMASPTKQRRLRDVQLSASALPRQDRPHHGINHSIIEAIQKPIFK
jgi:hypothetical protein